MRYKIIFYVGEELNIKSKAKSGALELGDESVIISGDEALSIPISSIASVDMSRMHGLGRLIKMTCTDRTIFLTVVRINLFGYFAVVNFFKTGKLFKTLNNLVQATKNVQTR